MDDQGNLCFEDFDPNKITGVNLKRKLEKPGQHVKFTELTSQGQEYEISYMYDEDSDKFDPNPLPFGTYKLVFEIQERHHAYT